MASRRGRPEDPIRDPTTVTGAFAQQLRQLRASAGQPPYRDIAAKAFYSPATLANATRGDRLPTLPVVIAFVDACGGDRAEWEERWRLAAAQENKPVRPSLSARVPLPRSESGPSPVRRPWWRRLAETAASGVGPSGGPVNMGER